MLSIFKKEPLYHYPQDRFLIKSPVLYAEGHKVLHVGGGPTRNHPKEVNLNLVPMENVDLVADAHRLPFANASMDVVISNAVLEHVQDFEQAMREIDRVLKPGGFVYIEVPFVQHYHTHNGGGVRFEDYRRLTVPGLVQAFGFCTAIDTGTCVGPTSALLQVLFSYFSSLHPNRRYASLVEKLYRFVGNLVIWIDAVLPEAVVQNSPIPSGVYYFGRKTDAKTPVLEALPKPNSLFPKSVSARMTLSERNRDRITVRVENTSDTTWLKASPLPWGTVHLGVQKVTPKGVDLNFKRIPIPRDLSPGASFELTVKRGDLDERPGDFRLDLVIEGICWFEQHRNRPVTFAL